MLRDDAAYFASRYEDAVREPDETWRRWVAEAGDDAPKTLFAADEDEHAGSESSAAFVRVDPSEVHLISMWVAPEARGRGVAQALIRELAPLDARPRRVGRPPLRPGGEHARPGTSTQRIGFAPTGDRAPIGPGRAGFKLLLTADAAALVEIE